MDELISRQAAIDAVEESRRLNHHQDGKVACAHEYEHRHFLKILMDLPSAQPEIPKWVQKVERMYDKALTMPYIQKPFAWALYQVWKEYDKEEAERRTDERNS